MTVDVLGRVLATYRRTTRSRTALLLIAANLIPLVGVLFFDWSLWMIIVLYWLENGIVGLWNVPKMLLAGGSLIPSIAKPPDVTSLIQTGVDPVAAQRVQDAWQAAEAARARAGQASGAVLRAAGGAVAGAGRVALAGFFLLHYGVFWVGHGFFVLMLPLIAGDDPMADPNPACFEGPGEDPYVFLEGAGTCSGVFGEVAWPFVLLAAGALFLSHGASFLLNYVGRGEYLTASPSDVMHAPYGRVVVLHLTIIFGAFLAAILGAPIGSLVMLVLLKTAFDVGLHLRSHPGAGARPIGTLDS